MEKISGLQEDVNENMLRSIGACRKFYNDKALNQTINHAFSKFGDIAKIDDNTYVDCSRNLMGLQQFHSIHPKKLAEHKRIVEMQREQKALEDKGKNSTILTVEIDRIKHQNETSLP